MDISEGMIGLALKKTEEEEFSGLEFRIGDVEHLPFPDASFSVVVCKAAFHHMPRYDLVFREMVRATRSRLTDCHYFGNKADDPVCRYR